MPAGNVGFSLSPSSPSVASGNTVVVSVQVAASAAEPVSAAQIFLNFDPAFLQVVESDGTTLATAVDPGSIFIGNWADVILNTVNNTTGEIGFARFPLKMDWPERLTISKNS